MFLGFIPILLLSLEALTENARASLVWLRGVGLVCGFGALAALQFYCLDPMPDSLLAPWKSARLNLGRLLNPGEFRRQADLRLDSQREQAQLPKLRDLVGTATVDVFGFRQSYALYNGMNFRPRPVSQSYAACNADLMRINQHFLQSRKGADFFLFEMNPLDSKFPALEDAMVLRDLILNFEPVAQEDRFVLLRRISQGEPRLRLLREATVKPGESIDLRAYGSTNLWIEIDLAPSLLGWLRQFASPTAGASAGRLESSGRGTHLPPPGPRLLARQRFRRQPTTPLDIGRPRPSEIGTPSRGLHAGIERSGSVLEILRTSPGV